MLEVASEVDWRFEVALVLANETRHRSNAIRRLRWSDVDLADLEHVEGFGWHGLRRKFADELREVPLKDLAELGGWKTEQTILECYMESDLDTLRSAQKRRLDGGHRRAAGE